jgi:hypothetical protein
MPASRARAAWRLSTPTDSSRAHTAIAALKGASERLRSGDGWIAEIERAFAIQKALGDEQTVSGDLYAALVATEAAGAIADAAAGSWVAPSDPRLRGISQSLRTTTRLDGVRSSFQSLLDEMYTGRAGGRGHLTGAGVAVTRKLERWHEPTGVDRVMEPAWYILPASRQRVTARFERLCDIAEMATDRRDSMRDVAQAILPLKTSMIECLRFPALTAVMPELQRVLVAAEESGKARRRALDSFEPSKVVVRSADQSWR